MGLLWLLISLALDPVLFPPPGPMQLSTAAYVADIGIPYLLIPVVPIGLGYFAGSLRPSAPDPPEPAERLRRRVGHT